MKKIIRLLGLALLLSANFAALGADETPPSNQAAPDDTATLIPIVVTGSRLRQESVQDTPIAVSVVSPQVIENLHGYDIAAISSVVPNVTITPIGTSPGIAGISLRGFTTITSDISPEPGIPIYVDGVYQVTNNGQLADLFDLQSLEVLRGPQGTLLGKNSSAGAILLTHSLPTGEFGGKAEVEYGSYNLVQVKALVDFPIISQELAGKLFVSYRHRDGWVDDLAVPDTKLGGEDRRSVRGALLFTPLDSFSFYLTADYLEDRSPQAGGRNVSGPGTLSCIVYHYCDPLGGQTGVTMATFLEEPWANDNNVTGKADWNAGGFKVTSISGYRRHYDVNNIDLDQTPAPLITIQNYQTNVEQYSEELRISSVDHGGMDFDGKLHWLLAAYEGHSNGTQYLPENIPIAGGPTNQGERIVRDSQAVFTHLDYDIIHSWTVSFGVRRSWDKTDASYSLRELGDAQPPLTNEHSGKWSNNSFEAGTQYKVTDMAMLYFRFAQGYRGGGFVGMPGSVLTAAEFNPETSNSYEVGAKTEWLDRRILLNLTLFNTKFKNLQESVVVPGPDDSFLQVTANAATATTEGIELESIWKLIPELAVRASAGYLDAHYDHYTTLSSTGAVEDLSALPLPYASKYTASLGTDYTFGLGSGLLGFQSAVWNTNVEFRDSMVSSGSDEPVAQLPSLTQVNTSLSFQSPANYAFTLYVNNVLDKQQRIFGSDVLPLLSHEFDNIGRTFGGNLTWKF